MRKISKELGLAMGDIQYHLNILEKSGFIKYSRWGLYKRYYIISIQGARHESILAMLQQETPREIILFLIENPGATQKELAQNQSLSVPTIKWHISKLVDMNLLQSIKKGRIIKYYLIGDSKDIIDLVKSYYPSIWNQLANSLADSFIELSYVSKISNTYNEDNVDDRNKHDCKTDETNLRNNSNNERLD